jgi:hypothetical protein
MEEYLAKSTKALVFELSQAGRSIGKLTYKSWFKFNALIEMENKINYQVEPKGFWGTTIELKDNDKVLLKFQMNWSGEIVIQTYSNNIEKGFILKHRGIFKESYILLDEEGTELLVMKPHLKWKKMSYEYQVTTSDEFELFPNKELLLMTSIHCANYYMSMITSMTGG